MFLAESADLLHPNLAPSLLWSAIFAIVAIAMFPLVWRLIDRITPGDLAEELLGRNGRQPNTALAIVVGAMVLGFCIIIAAAIH